MKSYLKSIKSFSHERIQFYNTIYILPRPILLHNQIPDILKILYLKSVPRNGINLTQFRSKTLWERFAHNYHGHLKRLCPSRHRGWNTAMVETWSPFGRCQRPLIWIPQKDRWKKNSWSLKRKRRLFFFLSLPRLLQARSQEWLVYTPSVSRPACIWVSLEI